MKFPHGATAAAAALIFASIPALGQTTGTPAPTTTQQPGPTPLPEASGQAGGPTRDMIRQMIDEALQEKLQEDRAPEAGPRHGERWRRNAGGGPHMGHGMAGRSNWMGPRTMHGARMQILFAIVDADGDGALSQSEVQDAVGRIFNAADEDGDGSVDLGEIQSFMHGSSGGNMQ